MATIPFLSKLGVLPQFQARSPTADSFPPAFNTNNKRIWEAVVLDFVSTADASKDWAKVISLYVDACQERGTYPFSNVKQSTNDQIFTFLSQKRAEVVKFINQIKLMDVVALRDSKRKVTMTTAGFTLEVWSQATPRDPTYSKWIFNSPLPRFDAVRKIDGKYTRGLGKGLTFWTYNDGAEMSGRWHIGYTIDCQFYPDIPARPLASQAELERFILDVIWSPIIKMNRPIGVLHRLL